MGSQPPFPVGALVRDRRGASAVEFALVGPVFFALIFAIVETGIHLLRQSMFDEAVAVASRAVYTGQAPTKADLEAFICNRVELVSDCEQNINVEAIAIDSYQTIGRGQIQCRDASNTSFNPAVVYNTGAGGMIMLLRVCLAVDLMTPGLGMTTKMPKTEHGRHLMISELAFMNEPL